MFQHGLQLWTAEHFKMFLNNKYTFWYNNIIVKAKNRNDNLGYTEKHHIIPKSLGGNDCEDNLVKLTLREHYLVHQLLVKMVEGKEKQKMINAFWAMANIKLNRLTSKQYGNMRILASQVHSNLVQNKWNDPNSYYNSLEYRKKQIIVQKEVQNRPEVKSKIFAKRAKEYFITSPEGTTYMIKGLSKFCREKNLHAGNMSWLANGKLKYYKGWSCVEKL